MSSWGSGCKAVCVDDSAPSHNLNDAPSGSVVDGVTYLVDEVRIDSAGDIGLIISGVPCVSRIYGIETGWSSERFRKVVTVTERMEMEARI